MPLVPLLPRVPLPPPQRRTGAMASTWRVFTCVSCGNRGFCRAMRRRSPHRTPAARGAGIRGVLAQSPDCRAKVRGGRLSWSGSVFGWRIAPATACVQRWPLAMQVAAVPGGFSQPGHFPWTLAGAPRVENGAASPPGCHRACNRARVPACRLPARPSATESRLQGRELERWNEIGTCSL